MPIQQSSFAPIQGDMKTQLCLELSIEILTAMVQNPAINFADPLPAIARKFAVDLIEQSDMSFSTN